MKITKVEAFLLSSPLDEPLLLPFYGGERTILKRDAMFIRLTADNGLKGYGPGPAHERAAREINGTIGPFLEGRDPLAWKSFNFEAGLEMTKTYRAVEVAVIDLAAKYEGAPMSELVGGRKRDRIKLYGSAGMYMSPEGYAAESARPSTITPTCPSWQTTTRSLTTDSRSDSVTAQMPTHVHTAERDKTS